MDDRIPHAVQAFKLDARPGKNRRYVNFTVRDPGLHPSAPSRVEKWKNAREPIGRGGQGRVFLQTFLDDTRSSNQCRAVKVITSRNAGDQRRYLRELETLVRFSHQQYDDHVVRMLGWYEWKDELCIVMNYFPHGDLQSYIHDRPPLDEPDAQTIISQVSRGLSIMHNGDVAHRDIKPQNILIQQLPTSSRTDIWWVKIADFGISKRVDATITSSSDVIGSLNYMAPEVIDRGATGDPLDHKLADIWSVGAMAFYLLTKSRDYLQRRRPGGGASGSGIFPQNIEISENGLSFVLESIEREPERRLKWDVAAMHAWFGQIAPPMPPFPGSEDDSESSVSESSSLSDETERMTLATRLTDTFTVEVSSQDHPIREQSTREQSTREQSTREQSTREQSTREQSTREQSTREQSVQEEPTPTAELQNPRGITVAESQGKRSPVITAAKPSGNATLHSAIFEGAIDEVKWFLERGADREAPDDEDQSPLYLATLSGDTAIVQLLIEYGASVNGQSGPDRRSIVHSAVHEGQMDIVHVLLEAGANLTTKNRFGVGPVHAAAAGGSIAMMELLHSHGANWEEQFTYGGETAMHFAAQNSNLGAITWLIEQGLSVNEPRNDGSRPIHLAAYFGSSDTVRLLAEKGADLDVADQWGHTAIMLVAWTGLLDKVELLANLGADPTKTDTDGHSPLRYAIQEGHVDVVKFLISRGTNLLRHAESACKLARMYGHADVVRLLQNEHAAAIISKMLADGKVFSAAPPYVPFPHKLQACIPFVPKFSSSYYLGDEVNKKLYRVQSHRNTSLYGSGIVLQAGPFEDDPIVAETSRVTWTHVNYDTNYILRIAPGPGGGVSYGKQRGLSTFVRDLTPSLKNIYFRFTLQGKLTQGQSLPEPETFEWRQVTKGGMQDIGSEALPQIFNLRKIMSPGAADTALREAPSEDTDENIVAVVVYKKDERTRSLTWEVRFKVQVETRTAAAVIVTSFHLLFDKRKVEDLVQALGYNHRPNSDGNVEK